MFLALALTYSYRFQLKEDRKEFWVKIFQEFIVTDINSKLDGFG